MYVYTCFIYIDRYIHRCRVHSKKKWMKKEIKSERHPYAVQPQAANTDANYFIYTLDQIYLCIHMCVYICTFCPRDPIITDIDFKPLIVILLSSLVRVEIFFFSLSYEWKHQSENARIIYTFECMNVLDAKGFTIIISTIECTR